MQSKYIEHFGDLIVSCGVILGVASAGDIIQEESHAPMPVATLNSNEANSGNQVSATAEKRASESNIVVMCVSIGMGITFLSPRVIQFWKDWRQADSETVQGKLAKCECRIEEMEREHKREKEELLENIEDINRSMELMRKSNEALNHTIEDNVKTIMLLSRQSSPVVMDVTAVKKEVVDPSDS